MKVSAPSALQVGFPALAVLFALIGTGLLGGLSQEQFTFLFASVSFLAGGYMLGVTLGRPQGS